MHYTILVIALERFRKVRHSCTARFQEKGIFLCNLQHFLFYELSRYVQTL